jgi:hypothetical protein
MDREFRRRRRKRSPWRSGCTNRCGAAVNDNAGQTNIILVDFTGGSLVGFGPRRVGRSGR